MPNREAVRLLHEQRARAWRDAALAERRLGRQHRRSRHSVRRALGRSMVHIGARLAGESQPGLPPGATKPVRST
jgi:hypothetical protein